MGATVLCLLKAFVQMLSMYKAKPEFVFGFSLIFKFYIRMPQLFFHDLQDGTQHTFDKPRKSYCQSCKIPSFAHEEHLHGEQV